MTEGIPRKQWDPQPERLPVLMPLIGSDLSMMEVLNEYGRPLFGRLAEMLVRPLSPVAIGAMLELAPTGALDACLVIGGYRASRRSGSAATTSGSSCGASSPARSRRCSCRRSGR